MPSAILTIEAINHVPHGSVYKLYRLGIVPGRRAWVAEICGISKRYGFERVFIRPLMDYSEANGKGTRGVYASYILDEGMIYEVSSPVNWETTDRYFCRVVAGEIERIALEEVIRCLSVALDIASMMPPDSE